MTDHEPTCDIAAQITALCDMRHPKNAVFLGAGEPTPKVPDYVFVLTRDEGVLLTTDSQKGRLFVSREILTDADMALLLGYPETKADCIANGNYSVVQARDKDGNVIIEALATGRRLGETLDAFARYGHVIVTDPLKAQKRRMELS